MLLCVVSTAKEVTMSHLVEIAASTQFWVVYCVILTSAFLGEKLSDRILRNNSKLSIRAYWDKDHTKLAAISSNDEFWFGILAFSCGAKIGCYVFGAILLVVAVVYR